MLKKNAFTLIELMVAVIIIGMVAAMALPNFVNTSEVTRAQMAQNNLYAILSAQQRFFEDNNGTGYCTAACGSNAGIAANLHITPGDNFTYSCSATAQTIPYNCTAIDPTDTLTLDPNTASPALPVSCAPAGPQCPS